MIATAQLANGLPLDAPAVIHRLGLIAVGATAVVAAASLWWKKRKVRERVRKALNWPTITATIEVPAVVEHSTPEAKRRFVVALEYFYRNPELQLGEYKRNFPSKEQAKAWAAQFKGRTVPVHVNPNDPADSVLLASDLAGSDFAIHVPAKVGTGELEEMPQVLSPLLRLVCGLAEIAGLAGMAASAVMFFVNLTMHGRLRPHGFYWTAGILLGACLGAAVTVQVYLMRTEEGRWLLKSYKRWCPGWMRWSLSLTGGSAASAPVFHLLSFLHLISPGSLHWIEHHAWAQALMPYLPYAIGCWLFFVVTAFHAALLRSQEEMHISVVEA